MRRFFVLLAIFGTTSASAAERELSFVLADIQPYVIRDRPEAPITRGLYVETVKLLADSLNIRLKIEAIPTRRYMTGGFKTSYDGLVLGDIIARRLPMIQESYEVIGPLFISQLVIMRRRSNAVNPLKGIIGQIGASCTPYLTGPLAPLKQFDIKDPEQGVMMLAKGRLDYLCLSDNIVYHLMRRQNIKYEVFEVVHVLTSISMDLLLRKSLDEKMKDEFRRALQKAWKKGLFQDIFKDYNVINQQGPG